MYTSLGELIHSSSGNNNGLASIDISKAPDGMYILEIEGKEAIVRHKILKQ